MSLSSKARILAAIRGETVDRTPVFPLLMFLAADRFKVPYRLYATNGHVMAEAQLLMHSRFGVDAITACSDAFRLSADLGGDIVYPEDKTPYLARPLITSEDSLNSLRRPDLAGSKTRAADRVLAVREMARAVGENCLVLGWVDMPFAEACSLCGMSQFMLMLAEDPRLAHLILEFLTGLVIEFSLLQLEAGAPMIGSGDAAASLVSARMFREFVLPYEQCVCTAIHTAGGLVKLHICGKTTHLLADMVGSGADLFNVDHLVDLEAARTIYQPAGKCYKGNLNPVAGMLQASPASCEQSALDCLQTARGSAYILSAGCEVPAGVADDVFAAFCQAPAKFAAQSVSNQKTGSG
jgi:MtaA/CmuA family methyltransferase